MMLTQDSLLHFRFFIVIHKKHKYDKKSSNTIKYKRIIDIIKWNMQLKKPSSQKIHLLVICSPLTNNLIKKQPTFTNKHQK